MISVFEENESQVRSYCRKFPVEFSHAANDTLQTTAGVQYIDFFAGAGAVNFGHNNSYIKAAILDYLKEDRIIHALDMYTQAKEEFITTFKNSVLAPRSLDYKIMFCGPTGTNAVEAALKLARKNKKRANVFAFSGAFHGMSLGSLAMTGDSYSRNAAGVPLNNVTFMPYFNTFDKPELSLQYMESVLSDDHSGIEKPAAVFLETVQAEGGIHAAPAGWLQQLRCLCDKYDILLVCDDIQVGIGRTGSFFSFERAGIIPDMVVLSKSISGFGLPMSLLLMKPELDIFHPAEHNGTFRGNQLAFVGAKAAAEYYNNNCLDTVVKEKEALIRDFLMKEIAPIDNRLHIRGIGMIWAIDFLDIDAVLALETIHKCFDKQLIIELAGRRDACVKILPPLTIEKENLIKGLKIIKESILEVLR